MHLDQRGDHGANGSLRRGPSVDLLSRRSRRHWIALACVLALAFSLRAGWIALAALDPSDGDYFDMIFYHETAHRLLAGDGYTRVDGTPTAVWPPLYPILLAGVYALSDGSLEAGRLANPFLGALTAFFSYAIGRRLAGDRAGLLAAGLFAACPDDIFFSNFVMSEVAFGAIFTAVVWLFVALEQRAPKPGPLAWTALGIAVALASLTRGVAVAWLAVPVLIHWRASRSLRSAALRGAFAVLGLALALAPWTLRNALQLGAPIPLATSLGRTLGHAHSPYQEGGASLKGLLYWRRIGDRYAHLPQPQREVVSNRVLTRKTLEYMFRNPGHELRIFPAHVREFFRHGHVGLEIGRKKLPGDIPEPIFSDAWQRRIAGVADGYFFALLGLGIAGLPLCFRRGDATALVIPLSILYFAGLHTLLFPDDPRYHLPILPFLAISAAGLIAGSTGRLQTKLRGGE